MRRVTNLLTKGDAKTSKGEKLGYITNIMYLSPYKQNSFNKNLCPNASKGCANSCLFTAGRGRMSSVQKARINKSDLFIKDKNWFISKLYKELQNIDKRKTKQCVRLNGTSDIPWENIEYNGKSLIELFPNIQFYDYTKSIKRIITNKLSNYHLTFSRSETNHKECIEVLEKGYNVAIVFNKEKYKILTHENNLFNLEDNNFYKVHDGDQHDLRFLDPKNVIIGLKAKGDANKDKSGFVL